MEASSKQKNGLAWITVLRDLDAYQRVFPVRLFNLSTVN